jgi:putative ABC transport system permease protein
VIVGVALSLVAAWVIETVKPLLTVSITWHWIAVAAGVAVIGAVASALYPAWRAIRVDVGEALTLE